MAQPLPYLAANVPPARVGDLLSAVDTPAALLDVMAAEYNILRACALVRGAAARSGVTVPSIRPHFKAHKCTQLASLQIALSGGLTTGMCCQKVCEAEACVDGGVTDVYVCNQIVAPSKIARLVALATRGAKVAVAVDSADNARAISVAACAAGVNIRVLIEVEVGGERCGVAGEAAAVALAKICVSLAGLTFGGLHAYNGVVQHARLYEARCAAAAQVAHLALGYRRAFEMAGIAVPLISGGGTGTFVEDARLGVLGELQPGSYVLADGDYSRNLGADGQELFLNEWAPALTLLARLCSRRERDAEGGGGWVVADAGLKAQSTESGAPTVLGTVDEYTKACVKATAVVEAAAEKAAMAAHALKLVAKAKSVVNAVLRPTVGRELDEDAYDALERLPRPTVADQPFVHALVEQLEKRGEEDDSGSAPATAPYCPAAYLSCLETLATKSVSDEHVTLAPQLGLPLPPEAQVGVGIVLQFSHCDPAVNHYDWLVAHKKGVVVGVWRLASRSPGI